jgi:hypothetical protein
MRKLGYCVVAMVRTARRRTTPEFHQGQVEGDTAPRQKKVKLRFSLVSTTAVWLNFVRAAEEPV